MRCIRNVMQSISNPLRILVPRSVLLDVLVAIVIGLVGLVLSVSLAFLLFDLAAIRVAAAIQVAHADAATPGSDPTNTATPGPTINNSIQLSSNSPDNHPCI